MTFSSPGQVQEDRTGTEVSEVSGWLALEIIGSSLWN